MSLNYRFSVGTISHDGVNLGVARSIEVTYDGDPQEFRGGDYRLPLAIELGNVSVTVRAETVKSDTYDDFTAILDGGCHDITLGTGANSGGLSGTLSNMVLVNYTIRSAQEEFVLANLEWRQADASFTT